MDELYIHVCGIGIVVGLIFPISIFYTHFASNTSLMFRKIVHSLLQVSGILILYCVAIPLIIKGECFNSPGVAVYCIGGHSLLWVFIPTVLLTRLPQWKQYHVSVSKCVLAFAATHTVLGAYITREEVGLFIPSIFILFVYCLYFVLSHMFPYRSVDSIVTRGEDGRYTVHKIGYETIVVGGGWSSFLNKRVCTKEESVIRSLQGEFGSNVWGAGTSIGKVQSDLKKRGMTLSSHPCISGATLGGWVFTDAHGSGGGECAKSIGIVTVCDTVSGVVSRIEPSLLFGKGKEIDRRYVILDVCVKPVQNSVCYRRVFDIKSREDVSTFLMETSFLRVIFLDRKSNMCILWTRDRKCSPPSLSSRILGLCVPLWLISVGPSLFSWVPKSAWYIETNVSDSNHFAPDPPYYSGLIARVFTNFELYVYHHPTTSQLFLLCKEIQSIFGKDIQGRCEVRLEFGVLFLDFSLYGRRVYSSIYDAIQKCIGNVKISLHKGKYIL